MGQEESDFIFRWVVYLCFFLLLLFHATFQVSRARHIHTYTHTQTRTQTPPQWGAADAQIKVPTGENTELKRSPFKAWSRLVYSHTSYLLRLLPGISSLLISTLPVHSPAFFPKPLPIFPCVGFG